MMSTEQVNTTLSQGSEEHFLQYALSHGFGELHFKVDESTGMIAMVAIHSTKLGPALGGCRFIHYANPFAAIMDAMRLARGMSYKAALVNLPLGGGKSVIIKPQYPFDRKAYLTQFGKFVNDLGGRYITAVDSGTDLEDMDIIAEQTPYVASRTHHVDSPSPFTARGVFSGIEAAVQFKLNKSSLQGLHIAVQGLGHVGYDLARQLHQAGATLTVADIDERLVNDAVKELSAKKVSVSDIHKVPCDVFSPCALGAIINDASIKELQTTIIAGAANNQLAHRYHGEILHKNGILYAPDYVINAGGLIFAAAKYFSTSESLISDQIAGIGRSLEQIFIRSAKENLPTSMISDTLAQEKIA